MKGGLKTGFLAGAALMGLTLSVHAQEADAPDWLRVMSETTFDGVSNDLITGGFGVSGGAKVGHGSGGIIQPRAE